MARKLPRLSKSLLDKPQLITASKFQEISEVLENREYLKSFEPEAFLDVDDLVGDNSESLVDDSVGILRVEGPTTYKLTGLEALCGGCSYTGLLSQMKEFVEQGKKTVLMKIDSPGGQAYRMMYTSRELRRLADDNDIKLIGYVDGMMASAGIGLGVACHEVIANPEAEVGSVGVVISLLDQSKALEKEGLKRVFITAGGEKVPFNEDGTFRDTFLADLQESVTDLYKKFTIHVADMRSINVQTVRDTEARMFKADDALQLGFIDKVMEENEFYTYLNSLTDTTVELDEKQNTKTPLKEKLMSDNLQPEASVVDASAEMATKLAEMQAAMDAQAEQLKAAVDAQTASMDALASYQAKEQEAEQEALSTKLDNSLFLAESKEQLMTFFMSAETSAESKELMSGVIDSATQANATLASEAKVELEAAVADKVKAEGDAEKAKLDAAEVKKEFGQKQESVETVPVLDPVNRQASVADWVAKHKK